MNTTQLSPFVLAIAAALSMSAYAQDKPITAPAATPSIQTAQTTEMTNGEIRKVDKDTKKITIKHGEIKNLDMPGMTMVFQVKDPAMLDKVKAGDKVKFTAEKTGGAIVVTDIQPTK